VCAFKLQGRVRDGSVFASWSTQVIVQAGQKGLEISLNLKDGTFNITSEVVSSDIAGAPAVTEDDVENWSQAVAKNLKEAFNTAPLQDTEQKLQSEQSSSAHIVVPGQGSFTYKNPAFSNTRDLMIEIDYKL
jgi:hypothetical protein